MPDRIQSLRQRWLLSAAGGALLALASPALASTPPATTAVPAGSCLRLNHTAQALTEFNNLGPQASAADARASFQLLQASEQGLQRDPALAALPAMAAVQRSWRALDQAFGQLPAGTGVGAMQQQLQGAKHEHRIALNGLIVSITCQP
ncbi:MAG: hypothetical protein EB136_02580 [Synechococcaceae bacterium WBB_3_034]|nr:hypothetical protein [Synechococcaceae bacterium WBB_3_034]